MAEDVLHVCVSCRYHPEERFHDGKCGGRILFDALEQKIKTKGGSLGLRSVECMSLCRSHCSLAFTGKRKMTMVFGRLNVADDLDATCDALMEYAELYKNEKDGYILRDQRPTLLQDKLISRVPPFDGISRRDGYDP